MAFWQPFHGVFNMKSKMDCGEFKEVEVEVMQFANRDLKKQFQLT